MDKFLFRYTDYAVLNTVKDRPADGVPVPFHECLFVFLDSSLRVQSRIISGALLDLRFASKDTGQPIGSARVGLADFRWTNEADISCSGGVPADCLYEFIRLYQQLSIYLYQKRTVVNISIREIIHREKLDHQLDPGKAADKRLDDRIISLHDLSTRFVYLAVNPYLDHTIKDTRKQQENHCDYAYWVRGHTRIYKTGKTAWVRPHLRNTRYPEQSHTYSL